MEGGKMFGFQMRKTFNSKRADFRKVKHETLEEFLARGGKIKKIPQASPQAIWGGQFERELSQE
jgi:hypothetical protein